MQTVFFSVQSDGKQVYKFSQFIINQDRNCRDQVRINLITQRQTYPVRCKEYNIHEHIYKTGLKSMSLMFVNVSDVKSISPGAVLTKIADVEFMKKFGALLNFEL